jgi:hypothetical protein
MKCLELEIEFFVEHHPRLGLLLATNDCSKLTSTLLNSAILSPPSVCIQRFLKTINSLKAQGK